MRLDEVIRGPVRPRAHPTSLRVAVLRHEPETGLGALAQLLGDAGVEYEISDTTGAAPLSPIAARGSSSRMCPSNGSS